MPARLRHEIVSDGIDSARETQHDRDDADFVLSNGGKPGSTNPYISERCCAASNRRTNCACYG